MREGVIIFYAFILTLSLIHLETSSIYSSPEAHLLLHWSPASLDITTPSRLQGKRDRELGKQNCPGNFCPTVKSSSSKDQESGFKLQFCHLLYDFKQVLNWSSSFLFCKMGIIKKHRSHRVMKVKGKKWKA